MGTFKVVTLTMFVPLDPAVPFPTEILIQCFSHTIYMPSEIPSTSRSPTPGWCLLPLPNTVDCPSSPGAVQPLTPLPDPTASTETLVSWPLWIQMKPPRPPCLHCMRSGPKGWGDTTGDSETMLDTLEMEGSHPLSFSLLPRTGVFWWMELVRSLSGEVSHSQGLSGLVSSWTLFSPLLPRLLYSVLSSLILHELAFYLLIRYQCKAGLMLCFLEKPS